MTARTITVFDSLALATWATRSLALGVLVRSLELLANRSELSDGRILSSQVAGRPATGRVSRLEHATAGPAITIAVLGIRAIAAGACLWLPFAHPAMPWLLGYLMAAQAYHNRRFDRIQQSSNTMFLIGLGAAFVASLDAARPDLRAIALTFLGAQALLAYAVTGWSKLRQRRWRNGDTLTGLFENGRYRLRAVAAWLSRWPALARAASWYVIVTELLLSISVFLPTSAFHAVLAAGVCLHVAIAMLMGLHGFLWSFLGAYPGVYFIHHALIRRTDGFT